MLVPMDIGFPATVAILVKGALHHLVSAVMMSVVTVQMICRQFS